MIPRIRPILFGFQNYSKVRVHFAKQFFVIVELTFLLNPEILSGIRHSKKYLEEIDNPFSSDCEVPNFDENDDLIYQENSPVTLHILPPENEATTDEVSGDKEEIHHRNLP